MMVKVGVIRDGTQGISLSLEGRLIGEWTDSRAKTLSLTGDLKVSVCGGSDDQLFLFSVPGKPLSGEQLSPIEVRVTFEMEPAL